MSRTVWVLGNWKQNHLRAEAARCGSALGKALPGVLAGTRKLRVGVAPTFLGLSALEPYTGSGDHDLRLLAQDVAAQESGAHTGEVGPGMLRDVGVTAAIIGHSERRESYGDTDEVVAAKVKAALDAGLDAVLCVGEKLEQRDAGTHEKTVISQLCAAIGNLKLEDFAAELIIAYEPVWAIGTGRTASPEQAAEMHRSIRKYLATTFGDPGRDRSILYGGSVKPGNAAALLAACDIDGFLIGGASLEPESLIEITRIAAGHELS